MLSINWIYLMELSISWDNQTFFYCSFNSDVSQTLPDSIFSYPFQFEDQSPLWEKKEAKSKLSGFSFSLSLNNLQAGRLFFFYFLYLYITFFKKKSLFLVLLNRSRSLLILTQACQGCYFVILRKLNDSSFILFKWYYCSFNSSNK